MPATRPSISHYDIIAVRNDKQDYAPPSTASQWQKSAIMQQMSAYPHIFNAKPGISQHYRPGLATPHLKMCISNTT
jgi:hypothetical protein